MIRHFAPTENTPSATGRFGLTAPASTRHHFPPGPEGDEAHYWSYFRAMHAAGWNPPAEWHQAVAELDDRPELRPGPHFGPDGRRRPPVGTLGEMIHRALHGDPPEPLPERFVERALVTR